MLQDEVGKDLPNAFASRSFNKAERNYSTTEKELAAIVWVIKHFRPYLYGRKFRIVSDHKPLAWIMNVKDPGSRLVRWRLQLEHYDYEIVYKPGRLNTNANALSRVKALERDGSALEESRVNALKRDGSKPEQIDAVTKITYYKKTTILFLVGTAE